MSSIPSARLAKLVPQNMAKKIFRKIFNRKKDHNHCATLKNTTPAAIPDTCLFFQHACNAQGPVESQGFGTIIIDTVDSLLKVLREVSTPYPPLLAAVGGICECIDIYKV